MTFFVLVFAMVNAFSQDTKLSYDEFVKEIEKGIKNDSSLNLKVDNKVFKNDRQIGYSTDYYYWNGDTIYKISVIKNIRFKKSGYTIYFKNNKPLFYLIDRLWFSGVDKPKSIYLIDNSEKKIVNFKTKNDLNRKKTNYIFKKIKSDFEHWDNKIKEFRFDKI